MGLEWIQQLGIPNATDDSVILKHNIQWEETKKKIFHLKNEFQDLPYIERGSKT